MNTINKYFFLLVLILGLGITSCVDNDFDEPENTFEISPENIVNIADVLSLLDTTSVLLTDELLQSENAYIKGGVVADDESGNLFKIVVFEDETGGLSIIPDRNELNSEFPQGKYVYIKLNGLTLALSNGLPQLGYGLDDDGFLLRIPDLLVNDFLFASSEDYEVTPLQVDLEDILESPEEYLNRLVTIPNLEFRSDFLGETYAITNVGSNDQPESLNAILQNCNARTIIARNSGFSNFADELMPIGNGSATGVVGQFGQDLQIFFRNTDDLAMNDTRCLEKFDGMNFIDIKDLSEMATSSIVELTEDKFDFFPVLIRGKVISSDESGNIFRSITIQDQTGGIKLSTDAADLYKDFPLGNEVIMSVSGLSLTKDSNTPTLGYGGQILDPTRLERTPESVTYAVLSNVESTFDLDITTTTVSNFRENIEDYINTLVRFESVQVNDAFLGLTYGDPDHPDGPRSRNVIIEGCEDQSELIMRNSGFATFASELLPFGEGELMGVASVFGDDIQIFIRNTSDLNFGSERCDGSSLVFPENEISLAEIKDRYYSLGVDEVQEGFVSGVVISDRGNPSFNNQNIVFQSGDDGIVFRFSNSHNYNVGDQIDVNVTGRQVSEFNGLLQISGIAPLNVRVNENNVELPEAKELTISEVIENQNRYESTRVLIKSASLSGGASFGNFPTLSDLTGGITLFTSSAATFANDPIPTGMIDVIGIVGQFNDPQIIINSPSDITGGGPGGELDEITIGSVKDKFYNQNASSAESGYISGVIISDRSSGQVNNQNIILQNGTDGIVVRFTDEHSFNLGQEIEVIVSGAELSEFNNVLQINGVAISNVTTLGSAPLPEPQSVSVSTILGDNNRYESTRVLIEDAMLSGGSTFGVGNITVDDGSGTINIFTFSSTSYANDPVPTGAVNVTAIVSEFQDVAQLVINASSDISGGTIDPGGNDDGEVNQDFQGLEDFEPVDLEGWLNIATQGDRVWYTRSFDDNGFAECEAFQDEAPSTEAWLITPSFDLNDKFMFSFETAQAFWQHQGLSVWISPDFTNLTDANWISIDEAKIANQNDEQYEFVASGDIDLRDYLSGKVRVGWKYEGTAAQNTTKMRIDNVELK